MPIEKPKEFSDAEAEAYTRYLTKSWGKKTLLENLFETLQKRAEVAKEKWRWLWWKK